MPDPSRRRASDRRAGCPPRVAMGAPTESSTAGAKAATRLGVLLLLIAALFDVEPLYVTAVAFLVLGIGCRAWVASGARGLRIGRTLSAARVVEDEPLPTAIG